MRLGYDQQTYQIDGVVQGSKLRPRWGNRVCDARTVMALPCVLLSHAHLTEDGIYEQVDRFPGKALRPQRPLGTLNTRESMRRVDEPLVAVRTLFTFPHVSQNLNVARDLLIGTIYSCVLEVIDKKLVPPPATTPGIGSPR